MLELFIAILDRIRNERDREHERDQEQLLEERVSLRRYAPAPRAPPHPP